MSTTDKVTVTTTPTKIADGAPNSQKHAAGSFAAGAGSVVEVHNHSASVAVHVGGKNVSTSSPLAIAPQGHAVLPLAPGGALYGITAEGTAVVTVIG